MSKQINNALSISRESGKSVKLETHAASQAQPSQRPHPKRTRQDSSSGAIWGEVRRSGDRRAPVSPPSATPLEPPQEPVPGAPCPGETRPSDGHRPSPTGTRQPQTRWPPRAPSEGSHDLATGHGFSSSAAPGLSPSTGSTATNRGEGPNRAPRSSGAAAPTLARQPRWPHSGRRGPQLAPRCFWQTGTPLPPHGTPHLLKINRTQGDLLLKGHFPRRPQDSASPKARKVIQLGRGRACQSDQAC